MIEKREGHGEDSNPLSIIKDNFYAVGVFDGMGGSGASICKSEFGDNHTKAYVASRIILETISNLINNETDFDKINPDTIKNNVRGRLEQEKNTYPIKTSCLRSKLVRDYPTTLAITTAFQMEDGAYCVNSYWAGDSRNYLWTQEGFYQISKDDLDTDLDPLENLRNDGALSNCICADRDFHINNKKINVKGKFLIISATDGCFNYFATPMHFQDVLLTGLKKSATQVDWENFCKEEFSKVTGDDVSISLIAIGFEDFEDIKNTFNNSFVVGIEQINSVQDEIKELESKIQSAKQSLETFIQSGWDTYKISYMKYICNDIKSDPTDKDIQCDEMTDNDSCQENINVREEDSSDNTEGSYLSSLSKEDDSKNDDNKVFTSSSEIEKNDTDSFISNSKDSSDNLSESSIKHRVPLQKKKMSAKRLFRMKFLHKKLY